MPDDSLLFRGDLGELSQQGFNDAQVMAVITLLQFVQSVEVFLQMLDDQPFDFVIVENLDFLQQGLYVGRQFVHGISLAGLQVATIVRFILSYLVILTETLVEKPAMISVAPMLGWTDRHFRYFLRLLSRRVVLYTEMVTCGAILYGERERVLGFEPMENPLILQLGGSDPDQLAVCAKSAEAFGYQGINLNVGCPSDRVQKGKFGACLMKHPGLVGECISAIREHTRLPVSVKCRTGVDDHDSYDHLDSFVTTVAASGCETFIVHARKAWLQGLSPKENRSVPPLCHDRVERLKQDHPSLNIVLNGGILDLDQAGCHLLWADGVMIGRAVYHNPYLLAQVDNRFYDDAYSIGSREQLLESYIPYIERQLTLGVRLHSMTRHLLGLYHNQPGARRWRRHLSTHACKPGAGTEVLRAWLDQV